LTYISYHVSIDDGLKKIKTLIKMDEQKSITKEKKAKKVLIELKKAIREGRIYPEPQGRKLMKKVYLQEVSPEKIRRTRILKRLEDLIKHKPVLIEYSGLLLDRFRRNPKVTQTLIKKNIRDLTEFYQRYPGIIEHGLTSAGGSTFRDI
jgi:hypothetical protein